MKTPLAFLSVPLLIFGLACRTVEPQKPDPAALPGAERPWTDAFLSEAVLVADEVRIEGPLDLLEHVAIRQDPEALDYRTETTTEGLRQDVMPKEGMQLAEIRCQLDAWTIVALRRLIVLQRPGEAPVRIVASGDVALMPVGGAETRSPRLEFRGDRAPR
jgi:hypothetical protein